MLNRVLNKAAGLYFITDSKLSKKTIVDDVKAAIRAGASIVQYREKELSTMAMVDEAKILRDITRQSNALLIINDRIDIAMAANADGVHLGQDDMPCSNARNLLGYDKIIGVTAHNVEEAVEAEMAGADYVGVSPVFATKTKPDAGNPAGLELVRKVRERVKIPIIAIGGINYENLANVLMAGADGVAAISAIVTKDDVELECKKFIGATRKFHKLL